MIVLWDNECVYLRNVGGLPAKLTEIAERPGDGVDAAVAARAAVADALNEHALELLKQNRVEIEVVEAE